MPPPYYNCLLLRRCVLVETFLSDIVDLEGTSEVAVLVKISIQAYLQIWFHTESVFVLPIAAIRLNLPNHQEPSVRFL